MKIHAQKIKFVLIQLMQIPLNIALSLIYFILILPYAFFYQLSAKPRQKTADPELGSSPVSFWINLKPKNPDLENLRRQF
jgi:ABC-type glycerol-3-phosphate transport system permease component